MQTDFTETIQEDVTLARLERLMNGSTVAETVSDIADEHSRWVVGHILLDLYVEALIASLESLHILNQKQVEELEAYFHVGSGENPVVLQGSGAA